MTIIGTVVTKPSGDKTKGTIIQMFGPGDDSIVRGAARWHPVGGSPVKILKCNDTDMPRCRRPDTDHLSAAQAIRPAGARP